jgi:DNA-binding CsgD family transcriptional regulator
VVDLEFVRAGNIVGQRVPAGWHQFLSRHIAGCAGKSDEFSATVWSVRFGAPSYALEFALDALERARKAEFKARALVSSPTLLARPHADSIESVEWGQVAVSAAVRDLMVGSGYRFGEPASQWFFHLESVNRPYGESADSPAKRRIQQGARTLTAREREVVALLGLGMTNLDIAGKLKVSRSTVERHVSNILDKLALRSRVQVAAWTAERGWNQALGTAMAGD